MSPWKRTASGCRAYIGLNLAARKAYFKGLSNPQPFAGSHDSQKKGAIGSYGTMNYQPSIHRTGA
jgi:hypothetical protein